jgi:hypothetical protein
MRKLPLITFLAAFLALGTASSDNRSLQSKEGNSSDQGVFPITVDFHCPRNFGFHIGDEIPLTVTMEAEDGPIVDLVNLPQKGEISRFETSGFERVGKTVGPFTRCSMNSSPSSLPSPWTR